MHYKEYKRQLDKSVDIVERRGDCRRARTGGSYDVILGTGLCVGCWDDYGTKRKVNDELREQARKRKSLQK